MNDSIKNKFKERTFQIKNNKKMVITDEYDLANNIASIETYVKIMTEDQNDLFIIKGNGWKFIGCKSESLFVFLKYFIGSGAGEAIDRSFPLYRLNPYAEVFIRVTNELLKEIDPCFNKARQVSDLEYDLKKLNEYVNTIRVEVGKEGFQKQINNHKRMVRKSTRSLISYINYLFKINSRILVLRVDLRYKLNVMGGVLMDREGAGEAYDQVVKDRNAFFQDKKTEPVFQGMVGYVWKLEHTLMTGFHYHCFFFFDGAKVRADINRAKMLGEYWVNNITNGKGLYFNCNAKKEDYESLGIGMIGHDDFQMRENLMETAKYLTKPDYYARTISMENGRTFGRGEIQQNKIDERAAEKRGRPRKKPLLG